MKTFLLIIFLTFSGYISVFSQSHEFDLKNLDSLCVTFDDSQGLISQTLEQKIITETALKLKSLGVKILRDSNCKSKLFINVQAIASRFAAHRVLLELGVYEKVQTFRKDSIRTNAITYFDQSFFKSKNIEQSVYDEIMDKLLIKFINNYMNSN